MLPYVTAVNVPSTEPQQFPPATMEDVTTSQHRLSPVVFFLLGSLAAIVIVVILVLVLRKFMKASELHKLLAKKGTSKDGMSLKPNSPS